jgi:hypothetical protein
LLCCFPLRVLVVGCSSQPWLVPKKDESAFMSFWSKLLHLPLPDYAARRVSVPKFRFLFMQKYMVLHMVLWVCEAWLFCGSGKWEWEWEGAGG